MHPEALLDHQPPDRTLTCSRMETENVCATGSLVPAPLLILPSTLVCTANLVTQESSPITILVVLRTAESHLEPGAGRGSQDGAKSPSLQVSGKEAAAAPPRSSIDGFVSSTPHLSESRTIPYDPPAPSRPATNHNIPEAWSTSSPCQNWVPSTNIAVGDMTPTISCTCHLSMSSLLKYLAVHLACCDFLKSARLVSK